MSDMEDEDDRLPPDLRPDPRTIALDRGDALLLVVDVQERLAAAMDPKEFAAVLKNVETLVKTAAKLREAFTSDLPSVV